MVKFKELENIILNLELYKYLLIVLTVILSGCAASMAIMSEENPNIAKIGYGSTRGEVESLFGLKSKTIILSSGNQIEYYVIKKGHEPDLIRGATHATFTAASLGLWDIIGVPVEKYYQREIYLVVTYDRYGKVIDVQTQDK